MPCFMRSGWRRRRLRTGKWACLNWTAGVVGFGRRGCLWCKKLSCCWYEGQSVKLAGWAAPQLTDFGGVPMGFLDSRFVCRWSHLTHTGGLPQKLDEGPKDWQIKHWRRGLVLLYFSHHKMQSHSFLICSNSRTSVPGWKVTTNTGCLFIDVWVVLSVFLIWEIFTTRNSWVVRSACISWTETLGECFWGPLVVELRRVAGKYVKLAWSF